MFPPFPKKGVFPGSKRFRFRGHAGRGEGDKFRGFRCLHWCWKWTSRVAWVKINMEPRRFGRWFSLSIGWFLGSVLIFRGIASSIEEKQPFRLKQRLVGTVWGSCYLISWSILEQIKNGRVEFLYSRIPRNETNIFYGFSRIRKFQVRVVQIQRWNLGYPTHLFWVIVATTNQGMNQIVDVEVLWPPQIAPEIVLSARKHIYTCNNMI